MRIKAVLYEIRIITALSGREYESVFRKYIFLIQVFVLENAEGNFLHDSASRVLRFQLRE